MTPSDDSTEPSLGHQIPHPTDRPQGLLTPAQREYLLSSDPMEEYDRHKRYRRREGIKRRIREGMFDLSLLAGNLDADTLQDIFTRDMEQVVEDVIREDFEAAHEETHLRPEAAVNGAIMFLLRTTDRTDTPIYPDMDVQPLFQNFIHQAERGTRKFLAQEKDTIADVTVRIELENIRPTEEVLEQAEASEGTPSLHTLAILETAGVSYERLVELYNAEE